MLLQKDHSVTHQNPLMYNRFLPNDGAKKDSHNYLADGIKDSFLKGLYDRKL